MSFWGAMSLGMDISNGVGITTLLKRARSYECGPDPEGIHSFLLINSSRSLCRSRT